MALAQVYNCSWGSVLTLDYNFNKTGLNNIQIVTRLAGFENRLSLLISFLMADFMQATEIYIGKTIEEFNEA